MNHKRDKAVPSDWWDSSVDNTFFAEVYYKGDDSFEGFLNHTHLDIDERTKRECDLVEDILSLSAGAKILDCPCGYGRHSIELARRGFEVTGIDLSEAFLARANESLARTTIKDKCCFSSGDMRQLKLPSNDFDACINMFFSFGFFDDDDNKKTLQTFYDHLRPGGQLLIHTDVNPELVANGNYGDRSVRKLKNGQKLKIDEDYNESLKRLVGAWTVSGVNGPSRSCSYSVRIYSHEEMEMMLMETGFRDIRVVSGTDQLVNGELSLQEVVYVARKS